MGSRSGLGQHPVALCYCCDGLRQHVCPLGTLDCVSLGPVTVSAGLVPPEVSKGESTARVFLACRGHCAPGFVTLHSIGSARRGWCGPTLPPCQALGAASRVPVTVVSLVSGPHSFPVHPPSCSHLHKPFACEVTFTAPGVRTWTSWGLLTRCTSGLHSALKQAFCGR